MIAIPWTTMAQVSQNENVVFWPSLKTKMARSLVVTKESDYMLSSGASGMTTSTRTTLPITGPPQVPLFATSSEIRWKKNFLSYVSALGDGRSRHCGRRTTTAGNDPLWLGKLGGHHSMLVPVAMTMAASANETSLRNLWILTAKLRSCSTDLNRRKRRRVWSPWSLFLPQPGPKRCVSLLRLVV